MSRHTPAEFLKRKGNLKKSKNNWNIQVLRACLGVWFGWF